LERLPPIYAVAIAIAVGDGLGSFHIGVPASLPIVLGVAACAAFLVSRSLGLIAAYFAIASAAILPAYRLLAPPPDPLSIRNFGYGQFVTIEGALIREPEVLPERTRLYVRVVRAAPAGQALRTAHGVVRVAEFDHAQFRIGDEIRLTARIRFPRNYGDPGEFDEEGYLARNGIVATMTAPERSFGTPAFQIIGHHPSFPGSAIEAIRVRIGAFIDANLAGPERAEMRALVIGDRGGIDDRLRNDFARTGMAHLLVISGLHLSFVAAAAFVLVRFLMMFARGLASRGWANKIAAVGAALTVLAYAAIAGHHVSTVRALVMVLAYMFAVVIDRAREAIASLALAAIVICVALPGSSADIGFQLSFASVIAIILGMRRFAAWLGVRERAGRLPGEGRSPGWRIAGAVLGYFAVSFWAMVGTAPLTAFHFNQFAMVGLVANAVVVPIMGFGATLCGLVAAMLSFVSMPAARVLLHLGGVAIDASNRLAAWFERWPLAWSQVFTPTVVELAIVYALLMLWLTAPLAKLRTVRDKATAGAAPEESRSRRIGLRALAGLVVAAALVLDAGWWIHRRYFDRELRVTFLSVGEGDSAVVRFPGSRVMLIDGGGAYRGFDFGERIVAPYLRSLKIMHVDYLVLSHPDLDHFGGLTYIADNFGPSEFWTTASGSADLSYAALADAIARDHIPIVTIDSSTPPQRIGGVEVRALNAPLFEGESNNNASMVLKLSAGGAAYLFTGDIEAAGENALVETAGDLRATVLKVPHHGSATSSTVAFIAAVRPSLAIISDGYRNRFHFPAQAVVDRYRDAGSILLRTDLDGAVMTRLVNDSVAYRAWRRTNSVSSADWRPSASRPTVAGITR
jgi:competence protein ComEC